MTMGFMTNTKFAKRVTEDYIKNDESNTTDGEDFAFYKSRIFKLTNQLLNNTPPSGISKDVHKAYLEYITTCIHYFKSADTCDIIQSEHTDSHTDTNTYHDDSLESDVYSSDTDTSTRSRSNTPIIRPVKCNMNRFVVKTRPPPTILPQVKTISLYDTNLQYKHCGNDSNVLVNDKEAKEIGMDIILPLHYFTNEKDIPYDSSNDSGYDSGNDSE